MMMGTAALTCLMGCSSDDTDRAGTAAKPADYHYQV